MEANGPKKQRAARGTRAGSTRAAKKIVEEKVSEKVIASDEEEEPFAINGNTKPKKQNAARGTRASSTRAAKKFMVEESTASDEEGGEPVEINTFKATIPKKQSTARGTRAGSTRAAKKSMAEQKVSDKAMVSNEEGEELVAINGSKIAKPKKQRAARGTRAGSTRAAKKSIVDMQDSEVDVIKNEEVEELSTTEIMKASKPKKKSAARGKRTVATKAPKKSDVDKQVPEDVMISVEVGDDGEEPEELAITTNKVKVTKTKAKATPTARKPRSKKLVCTNEEDETEAVQIQESGASKRKRKTKEVIDPVEEEHTSKKAKTVANTNGETGPPKARCRQQNKSIEKNAESGPQLPRGRKRKESETEDSVPETKRLRTKRATTEDQSIAEPAAAEVQELSKRKRNTSKKAETLEGNKATKSKRPRGTASRIKVEEDEYINEDEEEEDHNLQDKPDDALDHDETESNANIETMGWKPIPPPIAVAPPPPFSNGYRDPTEYSEYVRAELELATAEAEAEAKKNQKGKGRGCRAPSAILNGGENEQDGAVPSDSDNHAVAKTTEVEKEAEELRRSVLRYWSCSDPDYLRWLNSKEPLPGPENPLPQAPQLPSLQEALRQQPQGWGPTAPTPEEFLGRRIPHPLAPPPPPPMPKGNHSEGYLFGVLVGAGFGGNNILTQNKIKVTEDMKSGYCHARFRGRLD